jgi:hypothetical protein
MGSIGTLPPQGGDALVEAAHVVYLAAHAAHDTAWQARKAADAGVDHAARLCRHPRNQHGERAERAWHAWRRAEAQWRRADAELDAARDAALTAQRKWLEALAVRAAR